MSSIAPSLLAEFRSFVQKNLGLSFPPQREGDFLRALKTVSRELGFETIESCAKSLVEAPTSERMDVLAKQLTVGETYFFREIDTLKAFVSELLPPLLRARSSNKTIRFWSAGCCTGEEPYTLAILLREEVPNINSWNFEISATDLNPRFLEKARAGVYKEWSFRGVPESIIARYFSRQKEGGYRLVPEIKNMVKFSQLNLAKPAYPSWSNNTAEVDLIVCRNVLIYFTQETAAAVVKRFHQCLTPNGALIVAPSEASTVHSPKFKPAIPRHTTLYKKLIAGERESNLTNTAQAELPPLIATDDYFAQPDPPISFAPKGSIIGSSEPATHEQTDLCLQEIREVADAGELEQALEKCEHLLKQEKTNAITHFLKGTILLAKNDFSEAAVAFKRAIYLEPEFVIAYFTLANVARQLNDDKLASKCLENAHSLAVRLPIHALLVESDGLTAGRLVEIIESTREK